jgi:hypothetical protein
MSFLHGLAPSFGSSSSDRIRLKVRLPYLSDQSMGLRLAHTQLIVPSHGTVFINPPDDPLWPHARSPSTSGAPRDDQLFSGLLEVSVPPAAQRRRCRAVRVGLRTRASLKMSAERGWEEDVIFERKVELMGGGAEGMVLDEGTQR